jgi:hypothetical protein
VRQVGIGAQQRRGVCGVRLGQRQHCWWLLWSQ